MSTALVQVQFQGVEEGTDPKNLPPGTLKVACNYRMLKGRRLEKRKGTGGLTKASNGGTLGEGLRLQTRGEDITMASGQYSCFYSPELSKWQLIDRPSTLRITKRGLVDSSRSAVSTDCALWGTDVLVSVTLTGYETLPGRTQKGSIAHLVIENVETGRKLLPPLFIRERAAWARVHVTGDTAFVSLSTVVGGVHIYRIDLSTFTITGNTLLDNTAPECTPCDSSIAIHPIEGVPYAYVVWAHGGVDKLKVGKLRVSDFGNYSFVTSFIGGGSVPQSVSIAATTGGIYVMQGSHTNSITALFSFNPSTLATVVAGPVFQTPGSVKVCSVQEYDASNLLIMTSGSDPTNSTAHKLTTYLVPKATLVKTAITERITWQVAAMTKAWKQLDRWYTLATVSPRSLGITVNNAIPNASSVVLEIETSESSLTSVTSSPCPHMGTAETMTGWFPTRIGYVPQVVKRTVDGIETVHVPAAYRNREPLNFQSIPIGWSLYTITQNTDDCHRLAAISSGGLSACGAPGWFDGASSHPYGFATAPMILKLFADTVSGSVAIGRYGYVVCFEWRDANGILHRSPFSPPEFIDVAGVGRVQITVTTASVSQHQGPPYTVSGGSGDPNAACSNPVSIAVYRTTVGGGNYFRLTLEPEFQLMVNDPTVGSVAIYDTKADADIGAGSPARPLSTQPYPYTGPNGLGGELEDIGPPSFLTVVTHGGRLAGIGPDKRTVWFSKDSTEDPGVAPGFNEALTLGFAADKVALASLDEKLLVFGETGIDIVHGKGPDATGSNGQWEIQRLQTDVGCINPRSVATTPMGVVFESPRGIELVTRELTVVWIGKSVEDTLATYPTITSAVACPEDHEVRFTCNAASTGIVLAYDYVNRIWFTRKYKDSLGTLAASTRFMDAALVGGVYYLMTINGQVYYETDAHCLDGGVDYVETELCLAPLSFSGANLEEQRVKDMTVQGTSVSKHKLEISQKRDYATAWESPVKVFSETSPATAIGPLERCRRTFPNQRCLSMEVRLRDLAPALPSDYGTGKGAVLEGLAFRVQTKQGLAGTSKGQQG